MKFDKNNTESFIKLLKKIIISLMATLIILFAYTACLANNSEEEEKNQENEELTKNESNHTTSEDEKIYYEQVKPYIDIILSDFNIKRTSRDEGFEFAQKLIDNGSILENSSNNDIKPLSDLVGLFGFYIRLSGEHLYNALSTGSQEELENFNMEVNTANCYLHEFSFYYNNGILLQEQIEKDIKNQVGEKSVDRVAISSGGSSLGVFIKEEIIQDDLHSTKNLAYMRIYGLLEMLSKNSYYDYLDVIIKLQDTVQVDGEDKNFVFMQIEFSAETRKSIDFDNFYWIQIPDVADNYLDRI